MAGKRIHYALLANTPWPVTTTSADFSAQKSAFAGVRASGLVDFSPAGMAWCLTPRGVQYLEAERRERSERATRALRAEESRSARAQTRASARESARAEREADATVGRECVSLVWRLSPEQRIALRDGLRAMVGGR